MSSTPHSTPASVFATTHWTVVLEASRSDAPNSQAAFGELYRTYWQPLYRYVRRRGHPPADAEDITQDFLVALLEKRRLDGLEREGGKFRTFLLASLKNHLANVWDRRHTARRGGGATPVCLDDMESESAFLAQPPQSDPDLCYEREWAFALIEATLRRLEDEFRAAGRLAFFEAVRPYLQNDRQGRPYAELAIDLGLTEGALKVAIHRVRQRYGTLLREEIRRTIGTEAEVREELQFLIRVVGHAS